MTATADPTQPLVPDDAPSAPASPPPGEIDIWGASQLHVLSVGRGHLTLTITQGDDAEIERARKIITEMMERGYAIFVEDADGSATYRVLEFNARKLVYIIEDPTPDDTTGPTAKKGGKKATKEVPVSTAKATAVGRTAGG